MKFGGMKFGKIFLLSENI